MSEGYNGYTNYETWCVSLWISNDERLYRFWCERVAFGCLAAELEDWVNTMMPETDGLIGDLLSHAIGMVHWQEIEKELEAMV